MRKYLLALLVVLAGCSPFAPQPATFEDVSGFFVDAFGRPDLVLSVDQDEFHGVDWFYWDENLKVSFRDTPFDDVEGWVFKVMCAFDTTTW